MHLLSLQEIQRRTRLERPHGRPNSTRVLVGKCRDRFDRTVTGS